MNRFRQVSAELRRLSSAEAELCIRSEAAQITPTTEVRGRMIGPRCPGITTVEVAYPLLPSQRPSDHLPPLSRRVVIPEPSLWEPERPFVYHAIVELWEDDRCCDTAEFDYGFHLRKAPAPRSEPKD